MFEAAELGRSVDKAQYAKQEPKLRTTLLELQSKVLEADFPVLVLVNGVDGAGKGEVVNLLHEWMDPRYMPTFAYDEATDEERSRPYFWRFWRTLAPRGRIGVYFGSWYTDPIVDRVYKRVGRAGFERSLERVRSFERMLVDDGALIVKFWFHLSHAEQARRFKEWRKKQATRWKVSAQDLKNHARYDRFRKVSEQALFSTSTGEAPWTVIEATDDRYRNLAAGDHLAERIHEHVALLKKTRNGKSKPVHRADIRADVGVRLSENKTVLSQIDLGQKVDDDTYDERLQALQSRLAGHAARLQKEKRSALILFEGWDAAGKGGAIRRITQALDARRYQVVPIAAPSDEERAQHYLWRFWRHLPRDGRFTLYDRSWYGRVLVERVEGFASEAEWRRAYAEINEFEQQLHESGVILVKLWLHISKAEQLRRFKAREETAFKKYKISQDDYRNRSRWLAYERAVNDMVARTSSPDAPWHLVAANDKRHARLEVLDQVCDRLRSSLG